MFALAAMVDNTVSVIFNATRPHLLTAMFHRDSSHSQQQGFMFSGRVSQMISRLLGLVVVAGFATSVAHGHHEFYSYSTPMVSYGSPVVVHSAHVVSTPVIHSVPVTVYQPAYVVPTTVTEYSFPATTTHTVLSSAPVHYSVPVTTVTRRTHVYAPVVPTVRSYYAPRIRHSHFRHLRPRDVEIEIDYKRDGGYEIEVDYD